MEYIECNIDNTNQIVNIYHCNMPNGNIENLERVLYQTQPIAYIFETIDAVCSYYNLYKVHIVSNDAQAAISYTLKIYSYMLNIGKKIEVV